jgi:hypothetical protein
VRFDFPSLDDLFCWHPNPIVYFVESYRQISIIFITPLLHRSASEASWPLSFRGWEASATRLKGKEDLEGSRQETLRIHQARYFSLALGKCIQWVNGCKILFQKWAEVVLPAWVLAGCWDIRGQRVIGTSTRITRHRGPRSFQQMGNKCDVPEHRRTWGFHARESSISSSLSTILMSYGSRRWISTSQIHNVLGRI